MTLWIGPEALRKEFHTRGKEYEDIFETGGVLVPFLSLSPHVNKNVEIIYLQEKMCIASEKNLATLREIILKILRRKWGRGEIFGRLF